MVKSTLSVMKSIEAEPAALLVQTANRYTSDIRLSTDKGTANAKSLMSVISLGILDGQDTVVMTLGKDEEAAHDAVRSLLEQNGEDADENTLP